MWTIKKVLQWTTDFFARQGLDAPRVDAELLLAQVLQCSRIKLYIDQDKPLSSGELAAMHDLVARRGRHEPVAYLLGSKGFMTDDFVVDQRVLVPRPETELLVERAAAVAKDREELCILEIGTGSGALILSLLKLLPKAYAKAVDISSDALAVARANAVKLGLQNRVKFVKADVYAGLDSGRFDLLISNPPYIPRGELGNLEPDLQYEPRLALDGGEDGLYFYRRILRGAANFLRDDGFLALEIGYNQGPAVAEMCRRAGFGAVKVLKDYAKLDRNVLSAKEGSEFGNKILATS